MKNSKSSKGKAIAGTIVTLAAATVMMMAPMSQAQAAVQEQSKVCAMRAKTCATTYLVKGGGRSQAAAMMDAVRQAVCPGKSGVTGASWGAALRWYNNTWFSADINLTCEEGKGPRALSAMGGNPHWESSESYLKRQQSKTSGGPKLPINNYQNIK